MIETQVFDYVSTVSGVPCFMEIPANPPAEFIVIERIGGAANELGFNTATFAVQTYGETLYKAANLAHDIVPELLQLRYEVDNVSFIDVSAGPYNFTDTDNKRYRYQTVYELSYYETED